MITHFDPAYRSTKRIKLGQSRLPPPYDSLAEWISKKYDVTVRNVVYDRRSALRAPRLQVIVEHAQQVQMFQHKGSFDRRKQTTIGERFRQAIEEHSDRTWDVEGFGGKGSWFSSSGRRRFRFG